MERVRGMESSVTKEWRGSNGGSRTSNGEGDNSQSRLLDWGVL